jgi:hypothetical protein
LHKGCNTVRVTPGPDVVQGSLLEPNQRFATPSAGAEDVEPISPELVLVDPVLAERARKLLPEPRRFTTEQRAPSATERDLSPAPLPTAGPATRRWRRTAVLAALIFAAGAASGGLLGRRDSSPPRPRLEVGADATTTAQAGGKPQATRSGQRSAASGKKERRAAPRAWAANVLGVTADVDHEGVKLAWKRPSRSDHVVVVRTRGSGTNSVVVFRGRATGYRDASAHRCSEYRYEIVNYDPRGHRSTGVLTSVVTQGCT